MRADLDVPPEELASARADYDLWKNRGCGRVAVVEQRRLAGSVDQGVFSGVDFAEKKWNPKQRHAEGHLDFIRWAASFDRRTNIPRVFGPMPNWLFHNNGDGTFTDVSKESGIASHPGKALGVVATDINNDGYMDLFVSNDTVANFLFVNRGNGRFDEVGLQADVGYSAEGRPRSGMGVDSADFNEDGWTSSSPISMRRFSLSTKITKT